MKLSIIIPLYNNAKYLSGCIESLNLQGIAESDFEILIIDDGSTDNGLELSNNLSKSKGNIRVFHQENKGSGVARNVGIEAAQGDYLHFVDPDDYVMPGAYRFLIDNTLSISPDIVYFGYGNNIYTTDYSCSGTIVYSGCIYDFICNKHMKSVVWNKLYRRDYLLANKVRFLSLSTRQDVVFNWDLLRNNGKIIATDAKLYSYTKNPSGVTYRRDVNHIKRTVADLIIVNEKLKEFSKDYPKCYTIKKTFTYFYHMLFNRIVCTPFRINEIKYLFPRCANIGIVHLNRGLRITAINYFFHHPHLFCIFQNQIAKLYFFLYKIPSNQGDLIEQKLNIKQ